MLSSFINQATADDDDVEQSPPDDVKGRARPARDELVAHPFAKLQLSTSELFGKLKPSTEFKLRLLAGVVVFWNSVVAPDTSSAGNVASCSSDGGDSDVDSDSHGLVFTSPDNLLTIEKQITKEYRNKQNAPILTRYRNKKPLTKVVYVDASFINSSLSKMS